MHLELSEDQVMARDAYARFLNKESGIARVRAAMPSGFDPALWTGLAELGAFAIRVPEAAGGLGLGTLDATVLMEEAGRTLVSGPLAEGIVAARLLALLGGEDELLGGLLAGERVVSIAFHDVAKHPVQWVAGGAAAEAVIARDGDQIVLISIPESDRTFKETVASTAIGELRLAGAPRKVLSAAADGRDAFAQALEEWKLLISAALSGLGREAVRLAAAYACERVAFGQPIGAYQALSHPMADLHVDLDAGRLLIWKTIRDIADESPEAGPGVPLTAWWHITTAGRAVAHSLQTFGGYGLTLEYDIHLYNLRAKAWPLIFGDPALFLEEAGRRLYAGEKAALPDVGEVSIDFDIGDDARALAQEMDDFFNANLTPELKAKTHSYDGFDLEINKKMADARLLYPSWPEEWGGRNASPYALAAYRKVWAKHKWPGLGPGTSGMVGSIIQRFGSDELKNDVLAKIVAGEAVCSLGYSEPSAGSDVFAAKTRATPDGNGWRIDGQKMFTSGAHFGQYVMMLVRTDPDLPKHKGLSMFIVPLDASGVEIQPVYTFQDERTNITFYDGVKIPDSYRLGEVNGGVKTMSASLELEHSAAFGGDQEEMLRAAEEACREIRRDEKALIEYPATQARLAKSTVHVALTHLLAHRSAWAGVEKKHDVTFGPSSKLFSSEMFFVDAVDLMELTAPYSLSMEGPYGVINHGYRHAHASRIYGGSSQVHRSLIAERALGLPRSRV